ncbi:MAG: hypothetical protein P1V81_14680 [Planctomycetota bacterium]|nr:hypothetical protein [Planctomycetota bacterium]
MSDSHQDGAGQGGPSRRQRAAASARPPGPPAFAELEAFAAEPLDWPAVRELFADHALSGLGRRRLDELRPRTEPEARAALARCAELLARRRDQGRVGLEATPPLAGITDPEPLLDAARTYSRPFDEDEFRILAVFLRATMKLGHWVSVRSPELPAHVELLADLPDLVPLSELLDKSLDDRGRVLDDASPILAGLRKDIARLESEIERIVARLAGSGSLRQALAEGQLGRVHRRGGRPCLAVRARDRRRVRGIVHDRSQTGETMFIEPEEVVESGNRVAALRADERREVGRILTELTRALLERETDLRRAIHLAAEVELAVLSADWAMRNDGRVVDDQPAPGSEPGLLLRGMRHPLLLAKERAGELGAPRGKAGDALPAGAESGCVPIDLRLGVDFDLVVITGPNTGGKTLALKSAGLAALCVRLGLPISAGEGSSVPFYDGIFADIGDEQEVEQNLSTFSSHLVRIAAALAGATPRTLCLLDELGGGTDPDEGAALGEAVLSELLVRGVPTLCSTHLGRLKEMAYRNTRIENACTEFDLETLAPRFHLVMGTPGESRALAIARRIGLPGELLDRAQKLLDATKSGERDELFADLARTRADIEALRGRTEERLGEVEAEKLQLLEERAGAERAAQLLVKEAQQGLEERLRSTKPYLERAQKLLPQLPKAARLELEAVLDELNTALVGSTLDDTRKDFLASLKKGDHVWVPRYRKRCQVVRIFKDKRRVTVRLARQDLELGFEEISTYDQL